MSILRVPRPVRILAGFLAAALLAAQTSWAAPLQLNFPNLPPGGGARLFLSDGQAANYGKQSQLAGMPIKAGIRNITKTGDIAQNVLKGMQDGLTRGALQLGLSFATQGLDPLLGGLASATVTSAIDGLITAQNPLDPASKRKGIFAGIGETLTRAVGGFTEIGKVVPGDPVTTAQNLAKLNDFSTIVREQGLGAAVETYATSLLYRESVESLISAGKSFSIQQAINAQLRDPNNLVELDGQSAIQISLGTDASGNRKYLWVDPTTHSLIASLQGQDYIRYVASPKVDPTTRTAGAANSEITRTFTNPLTGEQIAAKIRLEAAGADWIEIQDKTGTLYRITPNSFQNVGLNADGTLKDGILQDQRTGRQFYFQNGEMVNTTTPTKVTVDTPAGAKELVAQVQTNAQGQTEVKVDRMELADEIVRATMGKSLQQLEEEARTSPGAAGQLKNFWERIRNAATHLGFKTDEQLAVEKAQTIDAIVKVGQNGDILMVGGPGIISVAIREATLAPVNHAGYLERDDNGKLWVIDINPRSLGKKDGDDFLRTPFEEWVQRQTVIVAGKPNNAGTGENPVSYLKRFYELNNDGRTFARKAPHYNYFGALFGGIPLLGDVTREDPNRKFCSELVCDTQVVTGNQLPGLPPNSWRTPGSLWRALPQWGKNLRDLVPPAQADDGNSS